jgi:hypothetical protein
MNFERDLFISYAHIDNMPLKQGETGWITDFHQALEVRLAQLLGERPDIWRDPKLHGNDCFSDEIIGQFSKTAAMVSVLSPVYLNSEWCLKEMKGFYQEAARSIGIKVDHKSRIFKVIKTAVPYEDSPGEIADTLGYEFFVPDPRSGRVKELDQKYDGELERLYWAKLDDVAHDIRDLLMELKQNGEPGAAPHPGHEQLTIYLAETCGALNTHRDIIKRELQELGGRVLPDSRLPLVEPGFSQAVDGFLDQCVLSIHLVGGSYGTVPDGARQSIVALQNERAAQKSVDNNLPRLTWIMPGNNENMHDERQELFLRRLRTDANAQYGADLFETSIEIFKHAIRDKLKRIASAASTGVAPGEPEPLPAQPMQIYVICDRGDLENIAELEDFLYRSEFDVILPVFEGKEADLIRDHRESLASCDAVLIYYGAGGELWMRAVTRGLTRRNINAGTAPPLIKAALLAPPVTSPKERFRSHGMFVIDGLQGFSTQLLEPFVKLMKSIKKD